MKILPFGSRVKLYFWTADLKPPSPDIIAVTEYSYIISNRVLGHNEHMNNLTHWTKLNDVVNMAFNIRDVIETI